MARPPRIQQAGAWYHVIARGIERRALFSRNRDYIHFLELVGRFSERYACNISAYVLMPNHFHLFVQTMEGNLSRAVQWLTTSYAAWFNTLYSRNGHLFQGRFKAVVVDPDEWAVNLTRYIHLNPVRVRPLGLDKTARATARQGLAPAPTEEVARQRVTLLRDFRWSSYPAYAGYELGQKWLQSDWILERCGRNPKDRRRWYREYCEAALRGGLKNPLPENVLQQLCLGGREFLKELLRKSGRSPARPRPGFEQIRVAIEKVRQETWATMVTRHGDSGRELALYLMRENGHSLRVAARAVGIKRAPTAGMAIKRFEGRLATDKTLRKAVEQVKESLR